MKARIERITKIFFSKRERLLLSNCNGGKGFFKFFRGYRMVGELDVYRPHNFREGDIINITITKDEQDEL